MSDIFHKSCYTARSSGYKYRTLSTNTGERKRRSSREENTFDRKFRELKQEIISRVDKQVESAQTARNNIHEKYRKINDKIDSMIELQNTVVALRKQIHDAAYIIGDMVDRVSRIKTASDLSQSQRTLYRTPSPIFEEKELFSSTVEPV